MIEFLKNDVVVSIGGYFILLGILSLLISLVSLCVMMNSLIDDKKEELVSKLIHPAYFSLSDPDLLTLKGKAWKKRVFFYIKIGFFLGFIGLLINIIIGLLSLVVET